MNRPALVTRGVGGRSPVARGLRASAAPPPVPVDLDASRVRYASAAGSVDLAPDDARPPARDRGGLP